MNRFQTSFSLSPHKISLCFLLHGCFSSLFLSHHKQELLLKYLLKSINVSSLSGFTSSVGFPECSDRTLLGATKERPREPNYPSRLRNRQYPSWEPTPSLLSGRFTCVLWQAFKRTKSQLRLVPVSWGAALSTGRSNTRPIPEKVHSLLPTDALRRPESTLWLVLFVQTGSPLHLQTSQFMGGVVGPRQSQFYWHWSSYPLSLTNLKWDRCSRSP